MKTPGACNNDILYSVSGNKGAGFTGNSRDPRQMPTLTPRPAQATSDQWFQWLAFTPSGTLTSSFYDRQYGNDERTGFSDFSLATMPKGRSTAAVTRATSSSMPPPTQFAGVFWGDYTGLAVTEHAAYPLWSDTRNLALFLCPGSATAGSPPRLCTMAATNAGRANDQDLRTRRIPVG